MCGEKIKFMIFPNTNVIHVAFSAVIAQQTEVMAELFTLMQKFGVVATGDFLQLAFDRQVGQWKQHKDKMCNWSIMLKSAKCWKDEESEDVVVSVDLFNITMADLDGSPLEKAKKFKELVVQMTLCPLIKGGKDAYDSTIPFAQAALKMCRNCPVDLDSEYGLAVGEVEPCLRCVLEMAEVKTEDGDLEDVQIVLGANVRKVAASLCSAIESTPWWNEKKKKYLEAATQLTSMKPKIHELLKTVQNMTEIIELEVMRASLRKYEEFLAVVTTDDLTTAGTLLKTQLAKLLAQAEYELQSPTGKKREWNEHITTFKVANEVFGEDAGMNRFIEAAQVVNLQCSRDEKTKALAGTLTTCQGELSDAHLQAALKLTKDVVGMAVAVQDDCQAEVYASVLAFGKFMYNKLLNMTFEESRWTWSIALRLFKDVCQILRKVDVPTITFMDSLDTTTSLMAALQHLQPRVAKMLSVGAKMDSHKAVNLEVVKASRQALADATAKIEKCGGMVVFEQTTVPNMIAEYNKVMLEFELKTYEKINEAYTKNEFEGFGDWVEGNHQENWLSGLADTSELQNVLDHFAANMLKSFPYEPVKQEVGRKKDAEAALKTYCDLVGNKVWTPDEAWALASTNLEKAARSVSEYAIAYGIKNLKANPMALQKYMREQCKVIDSWNIAGVQPNLMNAMNCGKERK